VGAVIDPALPAPMAEDVEWVRLDDPSAAGAARRAAERLAERLGFRAERAAELGLAVTEIASNAIRHGGGGSVLLRSLRGEATAVEVVVVDSGPGIGDVERARRDGHTTGGTLGIGLGMMTRLADQAEIFAPAGGGTIVVARFDADRRRPVRPDPDAAGITRPITGETSCGDAFLVRHDGPRTVLLLCDGLGHGPVAAAAAQRAVSTVRTSVRPGASAVEIVTTVHGAMGGTRGGAVSVAELDPDAGVVRFCGVGNVAGAVLTDGRKRGMVSMPGVAGVKVRGIRGFEYPLTPSSLVVLHSDGLTGRWATDRADGLYAQPPLVVAVALLREAGLRHDDAGVVVARQRP
jgi:anti-sigma regulatory factor (Ser/Thr protein kinase)